MGRKRKQLHGEIREGHRVIVSRGLLRLSDCTFVTTDAGDVFFALCQCGGEGLGHTAADAFSMLAEQPVTEIEEKNARLLGNGGWNLEPWLLEDGEQG